MHTLHLIIHQILFFQIKSINAETLQGIKKKKRKILLTQSFNKLHKAHNVTRGGIGKDLDVVCVEKCFKDIKDRCLTLP